MSSTKKNKAISDTEHSETANSEKKATTSAKTPQAPSTRKSRAKAAAKTIEESKTQEVLTIAIVAEDLNTGAVTTQKGVNDSVETPVTSSKNDNTLEVESIQEEYLTVKDESKSALKEEYKNLKKLYKKAKKITKSFKKVLKKVSKKEDSEIIYSTNLDYAEANGSRKALKKIIKALKKRINNFKKN